MNTTPPFSLVTALSRFVTMLILGLALTACQTINKGQDEPRAFRLNEPFTLGVGQAAALESDALTIAFDSVVADHRCPSKVECGAHGAVRVIIVAYVGSQPPASFEMNPEAALARLGQGPNVVTHEAYEITLQDVSPYPEYPEDLQNFDDYESTLQVRFIPASKEPSQNQGGHWQGPDYIWPAW